MTAASSSAVCAAAASSTTAYSKILTLIVPLYHPWTSPAEIGRAQQEYADSLDGGHATQPANTAPRPTRSKRKAGVPAIKPAMLKEQPIVLEHSIGESHSDSAAPSTTPSKKGLSTRDLRVVLEVPSPQ